MKIELVEPKSDKGWNLQVISQDKLMAAHAWEEIRETLLSLINTPLVKRAKPFLQGDCLGWLMVEFWTDNENDILNAATFIETGLK